MTEKKAQRARADAWLPQDETKAVSMWKAGKTAREIGVLLVRTRNSIIGKMHRLGMGHSDQANKASQVMQGKNSQKRAKVIKLGPVKRPFNPASIRRHSGEVSEPQPMALIEDKGSTGFRLIDPEFNNHSCKWWVSGEGHEARFCCRPMWGEKVYCKKHYELSVYPSQPNTVRSLERLVKWVNR